MKNLNVKRREAKSRSELSADAWDRKVRGLEWQISGIKSNLEQEWCVDTYRAANERDLVKAEAALVRLMANNPYEAA